MSPTGASPEAKKKKGVASILNVAGQGKRTASQMLAQAETSPAQMPAKKAVPPKRVRTAAETDSIPMPQKKPTKK
jgi:hypothetical protein